MDAGGIGELQIIHDISDVEGTATGLGDAKVGNLSRGMCEIIRIDTSSIVCNPDPGQRGGW